jgi:hypothetical protein
MTYHSGLAGAERVVLRRSCLSLIHRGNTYH